MSTSRAARVTRGALAAGVATFAALASHVTGGGQIPGWIGIAVPLVLSLAVCTVLAGRRLSLWRLSVAVASSQVLFHTLFVLGTFTPSAAPTEMTGHRAHGASAMTMAEASSMGTHLHADAWMWVMHGVAAVVTIAALYRGERAYDRLREVAGELARWARRRLLPVVMTVTCAPVRSLVPVSADPFRPAPSPMAMSVSRRGPPVCAVL